MIRCVQVYHQFKKGNFALQVDNQIFESKGITGFIGNNGSGKSTLFKMIAGITQPKRGAVRFGDLNTFASFEAIKGDVHLLSRDLELYADLTGIEQISLVRGLTKSWDSSLEEELKEALKVPLNQPISELSRGEYARLRLLLSLCSRPKVILIDEITNDLDSDSRRLMYQRLDEYSYENETQVFVATNILEDIERYASQIVLLKQGSVFLNQSLDELKEENNASLENICKSKLGLG